jgi:hypothetical protein
MMPSPTATTTRRGSFAGDGLAISAKGSSDMAPGDGGVARTRVYASGPLPHLPQRTDRHEAAVRRLDVPTTRPATGR